MQTREKNKQRGAVLTNQEHLKSLEDDLNIPSKCMRALNQPSLINLYRLDFWIHVEWASWSVAKHDKTITIFFKKRRVHT